MVIEATITAQKSPYPDEEVFIFWAILEDTVMQDGFQLRSVMRKLVPNNGGIPFFPNQDWDEDSSQVIRERWNLNKLAFNDRNQLYSVLFVQEKGFNQVYQAATTKPEQPGTPAPALNVEEELEREGIVIYPNPVKDIAYFKLKSVQASSLKWQLIGADGTQIAAGKLRPDPADTYALELNDVPTGVYFLKIQHGNGNVLIKKIVKVE